MNTRTHVSHRSKGERVRFDATTGKIEKVEDVICDHTRIGSGPCPVCAEEEP